MSFHEHWLNNPKSNSQIKDKKQARCKKYLVDYFFIFFLKLFGDFRTFLRTYYDRTLCAL